MKRVARRILKSLGYELRRLGKNPPVKRRTTTRSAPPKKKAPRKPPASTFPRDFTEERKKLCAEVKPFTMTNPEKLGAAMDAVEYVVTNKIQGAIVECGVWKGGSSMAMAKTLLRLEAPLRDLYLYDTFSGMTAPTAKDISVYGRLAQDKFNETKTAEDASDWARSSLDEVKANMVATGYAAEHCHYVQGKVEDTIPGVVPDEIAVLRLDTDWYESTKHEMNHLFPRLVSGGVLIIDDYGHWLGSKKAVDEYIAEHNLQLLLHRIDYSCRVAVKR